VTAPLATAILQVVVGGAAGAAAGLGYFAALRWNVGLFERGATPKALVLALTRFAALTAVFISLAKFSAFALLAGAAGLLMARSLVLRRLGGLQ